MKFKHYLYAVAMMATLGTVATACDDEDDNNTEIGKQRNRRTQIIITPKLDQFMDLIDQAPETSETAAE